MFAGWGTAGRSGGSKSASCRTEKLEGPGGVRSLHRHPEGYKSADEAGETESVEGEVSELRLRRRSPDAVPANVLGRRAGDQWPGSGEGHFGERSQRFPGSVLHYVDDAADSGGDAKGAYGRSVSGRPKGCE